MAHGITKRVLADSIKKLMEQKPLAKISVGDIVEECGLNRNSFYYHFKDKYDLVNWIFYTDMINRIQIDNVLTRSTWELVDTITHYFYENKSFYMNALSVSGQNSFAEFFVDIIKQIVRARIGESFADTDEEEQDFYIYFFIDAYVAATFRWLQGGAQIPPDKFSEMVKKAAHVIAMRILQNLD